MVSNPDSNALAFNEHGYLPHGRHKVTVGQLEALLVTGLPDDGTRRRLFDSWLALRRGSQLSASPSSASGLMAASPPAASNRRPATSTSSS